MKEIIEFRIPSSKIGAIKYDQEGVRVKRLGDSVIALFVPSDHPLLKQIINVDREYGLKKSCFYTSHIIRRKYTNKEIKEAELFKIEAKVTFEPSGEECGTIYDINRICPTCGIGRELIGYLHLQKNSIPRKDFSKTISNEYIVSEKFKQAIVKWGIRGVKLEPIQADEKIIENFFHIEAVSKINLSNRCMIQDDLTKKSVGSEAMTAYIQGYKIEYEREVYICPEGHLLGLNLLSEAFIDRNPNINKYDYLWSEQLVGVVRGCLYPKPVQLCSPKFRQMVIEEKLTGFDFEIAHVV